MYVLSGVRTNQSILYVLWYVGDFKSVLLIRSYVLSVFVLTRVYCIHI